MENDLCDRSNKCLTLNASSREVHENFALDWKVKKNELLFQRWMAVSDHELQYHPLEDITDEKIEEARTFCKNVSS